MHPHLYERIEELLAGGAPVTLADMIGWVDFRERLVMSYEELSDALARLHRAGRIARVGDAYVAAAEAQPVCDLPTPAEYAAALAGYTRAMDPAAPPGRPRHR